VLSNQPQGGFITRKPTPSADALIASDDRYDNGFSFFQRNWNSQIGNTRRQGGQNYYWMR
jgi:hypothetical protein